MITDTDLTTSSLENDMDHITAHDPEQDLPVGGYLLSASREIDETWWTPDEELLVEAASLTEAVERATAWGVEWADPGRFRGELYLITGDDSSRRVAVIRGSDWSLT